MDGDAWAELYGAHRESLWRYVYARTGNRDLADEVVQQVFAEAVSAVARYTARGKPILAWLYAIAKNHTSKALRRNRDLPMTATMSEDTLDARVETLSLQSALARLPKAQRDVLILRFVSGYSTEEIAQAFGKSPAAVYSLQARALRASRRVIENQRVSGKGDELRTPAGIDTVR
jgi:RNA polymerase sigma-70 factor (ECF subfamily)